MDHNPGTQRISMRHRGRIRGRLVKSMNSFQPIVKLMNPPHDLMTGYCELSWHLLQENIAGGHCSRGSFHDENMDKWGFQQMAWMTYLVCKEVLYFYFEVETWSCMRSLGKDEGPPRSICVWNFLEPLTICILGNTPIVPCGMGIFFDSLLTRARLREWCFLQGVLSLKTLSGRLSVVCNKLCFHNT